MGLFGGGNSSSAVSNDNRDQHQSGGNGALMIGAGASAVGVDPGVIGAYMQGVTQQTDAVRSLAQFGSDELKNMGQSVTDILGLAANNATTSWEHTLNKSADVLKAQTQTAATLAQQAVIAANPNQSTNDTLIKIAGFVAVAVVAWALLRKKAA